MPIALRQERQQIVSSSQILPWHYYHFFTFVEPALTIGGAVYAIFSPRRYHLELIPSLVMAGPITSHPASIMAIRQLGSCYFLLAMLAAIGFRKTCNVLKNHPAQFEPIVHAYLLCLAIADWTHIAFTLYDLGQDAALRPFTRWNHLVQGNISITLGLFIVRALWFAGVARSSVKSDRGLTDEARRKTR